jgi:DNA polymerase-4
LHGAELRARALGIFDAPVLAGRGEAKSISRETTFDVDEPDGDRLRAILRGQSERVTADLARQGRAGRTVTLKLRFPPFETISRSLTTGVAVELADDLHAAAVALFDRAWAEHDRRPVRLLGVGVSNLQERARQLRLGETLEADRLQDTVAELRDRFGDAAVRRGAEIRPQH